MKRILAAIAVAMALFLVTTSPVAASSQKTKFVAYLKSEYAAVSSEMDLYDDLTYDLGMYDYASSLSDMNRFYTLAKNQVVWLNNHKPAACYKSAWAASRNEWTQFREAAAAGKLAIRDNDWYALDDFEMHIGKAVKYQESATAKMKTAYCP